MVGHFGHRGGRRFGNPTTQTQCGDHGALLSLAPILPQDYSSAAAESHHTAGGEKVKAGGDFRRLVPSDEGTVRFLSADLVKGLPFCDPVGADARSERFHLIA